MPVQKINRLLHYYLQTLSPVHVGSGARLRKRMDYFSASGRIWLLHKQRFESVLAKHQQALEDYANSDDPDVYALAGRHHLDLASIIDTSYSGEAEAEEMFEFVRSGTGVPYLPGSSIKGALRTVLLWKISQDPNWQQSKPQLLAEALQARDERWAATAFTENAFNIAVKQKRLNDSNHDLMRVLHVSDVHFSSDDIEFADTRIFNLTDESSAGWKKMKSRNEKIPRDGTPLAAEALRLKAAAIVTLTIDDFLLQSDAAQIEGEFRKNAGLFNSLPKICNDYAARQIAKQRAFFEKYKLTALVNFYDELEKEHANLPEGDFLLRLSWGSGWQGMTGELVEDSDDMQRIRKKFNMGKFEMKGDMPEECPVCGSKKIRPDNRKEETGFCFEGMHNFPAPGVKKVLFPIFPKTRKVVLDGSQPRYPFGWIVFRQTQPQIPPAENRSKFTPPPYKATHKTGGASTQTPLPPPPPIPKQPKAQKEVAIRTGDKLRAELFKIEPGKYFVRLLEKDAGRELTFTGTYLPVSVGDLVEVRVKATNPAGNQVTKIEFVSKIKK